ncbi:MAG: hypothetical protein R3F34_01870 [Planctomycetota bacterium]
MNETVRATPVDAAEGAGGLERLLDRLEPLTDRLNPIVVKEVRQVLRARGFAWSYFALVVLAAVIGAFMVLGDERNPSDALGLEFLMLLQVLLGVGLLVVVPLQSFQSLGAEWEGDTYDQLAMSGLRPRNIVSGKFVSAFVQTLLMTAAFAPFIALAFLMRGVDLLAMGFVVMNLVLFSAWASAIALGVSSLTTHRLARVVLFVALAAALTLGLIGTIQYGSVILTQSALLREPIFVTVVASAYLGGSLVALYFHLVACGKLAHPEENAATPLRLFTIGGTVFVVGWAVAANAWWSLPDEAVDVGLWMLGIALALNTVLWATERERLGRRVANEISLKHGAARFVPAALLPGGGRGLLFGLVLLAVVAGFDVLLSSDASFAVDSRRWFVAWVLCYASFFVGTTTLFTRRLCDTEFGTYVARLLVVVVVVASILVPTVLGLLVGDRDLRNFRHALNAPWVLIEAGDGSMDQGLAVAVVGLGLVGLVLNALRIARGVGEVRRARRGSHAEDDPAVVRSRERAAELDRASESPA